MPTINQMNAHKKMMKKNFKYEVDVLKREAEINGSTKSSGIKVKLG